MQPYILRRLLRFCNLAAVGDWAAVEAAKLANVLLP